MTDSSSLQDRSPGFKASVKAGMAQGDFEPVGNLAIAKELNLSIHAIKKRLGNVYDRCGIRKGKNNNRAALMYFVAQHGIVSPRDYDDSSVGTKP